METGPEAGAETARPSSPAGGAEGPLSPEDLEWRELVLPKPGLDLDLGETLSTELTAVVKDRVPPGSRVAVAVGSRGIARVAEVVAAVVAAVREQGSLPLIVPAMGSHGGATAEGQVETLRELGVEEATVGAAVEPSMETEAIGTLSGGQTVYISKVALGCDLVVPVNRVKPHSDFRAPVESGLTKMVTIGLGKERGAASLHSAGFEAFVDVLPEAARLVLSTVRVPFGVALIEDRWHRLLRAAVVPGEDILAGDEELLREAWGHFGRLPFDLVDVLLLREMGKTISGAGMDPNVTGRFAGQPVPVPTKVGRLAVLDLVESSGGNANGVGLADVVTARLRDKVDWPATYANSIASKSLPSARLPLVANTDWEALAVALSSLTGAGARAPGVVAMANTLEVTHIAVSGPLVPAAASTGYRDVGPACRAEFGPGGELRRIGGLRFFDLPD